MANQTKLGDVKIGVLFDTATAARGLKTLTDAMAKIRGEADPDVKALRQLHGELEAISSSGAEAGGIVDGLGERIKESGKKSRDTAGHLAKMGLALNAVKQIYSAWHGTISSLTTAQNELLASQRQIEAQAKLTGTPLAFLTQTAKEAKKEFSLSKEASNQFTIELSKLAGKAGDVTKTGDAIAALLDLGAAKGLSAQQSLDAVGQAILGIDEGTDKLFGKNPSAIYDEWAKAAGTTAGKMNDMQKAQALLDAVLRDGEIVHGEYDKFLKSAAGAAELNNTRSREWQQTLGEFLNVVMKPLNIVMGSFLSTLNSMPKPIQVIVAVIGFLTGALVTLQFTGMLPLIREIIPQLLVKLGLLKLSFATLTGPVGLVMALVTALGLLVFAHRDAAAAADSQAKAEMHLADIASQVATETIGMTEKEIASLAQSTKTQIGEMERTLKMARSLQASAAQGAPYGGKPQTVNLLGTDVNIPEMEKNLTDLTARLDAYTQRLEVLKKMAATPAPGGGGGGGTESAIEKILGIQTKKKTAPEVPVSGGVRGEPAGKEQELIGTLFPEVEGNKDALQKAMDYWVTYYDQAKAAQSEFQSFFVSSMQSAVDSMASMLATGQDHWDQFFEQLKAGLFSLGINLGLNAVTGGLWGQLSGFGGNATMTVPRSTLGGGTTQSTGAQISALRSDLRNIFKQGLNAPTVVIQGALPGQEFYAKSTHAEQMKFQKRTF